MRGALILLASLSLISCGTNRLRDASSCVERVMSFETVPKLGDHLSNLPESCVLTMAASAQMWPGYQSVAGRMVGTRFTLGVDGDAVVRYVATSDRFFRSPEGLRVGDSAAAAAAAAPRELLMQERGWGWFIQLPSGWCAFIDDSSVNSSGQLDLNLGTRPLRPDASITMFFMRR
jgi:hypothetical protein